MLHLVHGDEAAPMNAPSDDSRQGPEHAIRRLIDSQPDRDLLLINHRIDRGLHLKLSQLVQEKKRHKACTVFLITDGGDPNGGYRIARCLRHHYSNLRLVIPSFCKSAGTLVAIAADHLAIGDLGELGPLDIQVRKGSELLERSSGLDIMQALQAVTVHSQGVFHRVLMDTRNFGLSTKLCAEFAAEIACGLAAPLMSQIDPIRLGEMQRATRVAFEYGERLNRYAGNLRENALNSLISNYPAHGFVIDRKEAGELFTSVSALSEEEQLFCVTFWHLLDRQRDDLAPLFIELEDQQESTDVPPADASAASPESAGEAA